jgi:RNA-directed DNA polymerase
MLSGITSKKLEGIQKCSKTGRKVQDLFKIMTNQTDIWMEAYANIYANKGATTKGINSTTMDGFADDRVINLVKLLKEGKYYPKPCRRVYVPKAKGKRPLGIPAGDDKLVQEVVRMLLEKIYEPIFSKDSHGFRPGKSCHTALESVGYWNGIIWLIEFDIEGFFNNINHKIMVKILEKRIDDWKFIKIIKKMLEAGYMEDWKYHRTYSGTPQGGVCSPILANIYLNELDEFVANIPYNKGKKRTPNPEYRRVAGQICQLRQRIKKSKKDGECIQRLEEELEKLGRSQRSIPSTDRYDPSYRRLWYCRYADDFLMGIIGPKDEAEAIQSKVEEFLKKELNLQLSKDKTRIIHAKTEDALFLGYKIGVESDEKLIKEKHKGSYALKRTKKGVLKLRAPEEKIKNFCEKRGYGKWEITKAAHRSTLLNLSDMEIVSLYNAELRGIANYYALADDVKMKLSKLFYMAKVSLIKTLAYKHKVKARTIYSQLSKGNDLVLKYKCGEKTKEMRVFKLMHLKKSPRTYGGIDEELNILQYKGVTELLERLNVQQCEICGKQNGYFDVHHVRKLSDIKDGKQRWQKLMIARRRKTLVLCIECHQLLHAGKLPDWRFKDR